MAYEAEVLEELGRLRSRLPGVTGVIAAGVDGLVLAEDAPGVEPEGIAALVAAALGVALRLVDVTGRRAFRELLIRGEDGYVGVYAAGASRVLAVLAEPRINVGRLHLEARRCGSALAAPRGAVRPAPAARPVQPASGRPDV
ncbi:roadblock/LC7 domain-containing protein [Streptomyces sp. SL13]|uniref:Roadblock/LC7 domain-containing protein n=1 Tax=Streptantibioticus silvisoli TaxID=2705255 RepID=A0AA90H7T5_9ACTN|nr:roadblock/LC7 domain-containing protein [Streptantibioticus silvisoli]MDI5972580.1 roadblock/LC7 domain-containing protein [Streptantibioticus silvisoli]